MNSLFFEASAKTSVGVTDAFREVVRRIVAEPELISGDKPKTGKATTAKAGGAVLKNQSNTNDMPGTISLDDAEQGIGGGGCAC
jgi:Ras-related protein Rab-18